MRVNFMLFGGVWILLRRLLYVNIVFCLLQYVAVSAGIAEGDMNKLAEIVDAIPEIKYLCLDVANGYSETFVQFVRDVRSKFKDKTIMVGYGGSKLHRNNCTYIYIYIYIV